MIRCSNCFRVNVGYEGLSSGQSSDTRNPCWISCAADAMTSGVSRLSMPSWSLGPKRPQAFPGGPLGSRGRQSKEGQGFGVIVLIATDG